MKCIANLMDAQMPSPPSVADFLSVLRGVDGLGAPAVDALLGSLPASGAKPTTVNKKNHAALKNLLRCVSICEANGASFPSLDELFVSWGRFTVHANQLYSEP
jgi:hypothetical protein